MVHAPDLKDHPATSLGLEITVNLPGTLSQVWRMDEVNTALGCSLVSLDVMARQANTKSP